MMMRTSKLGMPCLWMLCLLAALWHCGGSSGDPTSLAGSNAYCKNASGDEYCGIPCGDDAPCPTGYYCGEGECRADCNREAGAECGSSEVCQSNTGACLEPSSVTTGGVDGSCLPPDVLIVLDVSQSMRRQPQGAQPGEILSVQLEDPTFRDGTKWGIAVRSLKALAPRIRGIRLGLDVFPANAGSAGEGCKGLADLGVERYVGDTPIPAEAENEVCLTGSLNEEAADYFEPPVPLSNAGGSAISSYLDRDTTPLCDSTPTHGALERAQEIMRRSREADEAAGLGTARKQIVVLLTDGEQTCRDDSAPQLAGEDPYAFETVQALAEDGVRTHAIGFDNIDPDAPAGVDGEELNAIACAGGTAEDPDACPEALSSIDDISLEPQLYIRATDEASLTAALEESAASECCGACLE